MIEPLNIDAQDAQGRKASITISMLSNDSVELSVTDAGSDNLYTLTGVTSDGPGVAHGTTSVWGQHPAIHLAIMPDAFHISVDHMWFAPSPMVFKSDAATLAKAKAWLTAAAFPYASA